jgi:signal peptidase I
VRCSPTGDEEARVHEETSRPRKPWLAALVSLFVPGLGHVYAGRLGRGLVLFGVRAVVLLRTFVLVHGPVADATLVGFAAAIAAEAVVTLFAVADAWRIARQGRAVYAVREFQRPAVYGLMLAVAVVSVVAPSLLLGTRAWGASKLRGDNMRPNLLAHDRVFINYARLDAGTVERGDVVAHVDEKGMTFLHRVVGLPGDRIALDDGIVVLNGTLRRTDGRPDGFVREWLGDRGHLVSPSGDFAEVTVPGGEYFVLGDNRGASRDSRSLGTIPRAAIVGRAEYVLWDGGAWTRTGAIR